MRRKPLKVTKQASTEHRDNYMQLNQYKLMGQVGQGSYSIVKLAYNVAEDTNYVSELLAMKRTGQNSFHVGNENSFQEKASEEGGNFR